MAAIVSWSVPARICSATSATSSSVGSRVTCSSLASLDSPISIEIPFGRLRDAAS
jgi:hypothetical protein